MWDSISYKEKEDTEILIFDKNTFNLVLKTKMKKIMVWHFTNGYHDKDNKQLILEAPLYPNFNINNWFTDVAKGVM